MNSLHEETPVTDREISLKRLGGDAKLLATLASFFLEDAPALMHELEDAVHSGDMKMVVLRSHSLKGLSATFEAIPFRQTAAEIEALARAGDDTFVDKMPQLKFEYERLIVDLQQLSR